jgi:hypothetical protein
MGIREVFWVGDNSAGRPIQTGDIVEVDRKGRRFTRSLAGSGLGLSKLVEGSSCADEVSS